MTGLRRRWRRLRRSLAPNRSDELARVVPVGASVLDVGCGSQSPFVALRSSLAELAGIDAFPQALEASTRSGAFDRLVEGDVRELARYFSPGSYDVVAAVDLLEHLTPEDAAALLASMEEVARRRVVVFTPNGFVHQGAREGNPWQVHRSGWTTEELRSRGYRVVGMHGLRIFRGEEAQLRFRPARAWALVSDVTAPIARRRPQLAYHLLAVKDVG